MPTIPKNVESMRNSVPNWLATLLRLSSDARLLAKASCQNK